MGLITDYIVYFLAELKEKGEKLKAEKIRYEEEASKIDDYRLLRFLDNNKKDKRPRIKYSIYLQEAMRRGLINNKLEREDE